MFWETYLLHIDIFRLFQLFDVKARVNLEIGQRFLFIFVFRVGCAVSESNVPNLFWALGDVVAMSDNVGQWFHLFQIISPCAWCCFLLSILSWIWVSGAFIWFQEYNHRSTTAARLSMFRHVCIFVWKFIALAVMLHGNEPSPSCPFDLLLNSDLDY